MPKFIVNESITVVRNNKRVMPEIGKIFDFTNDEVESIKKIRPQAISEIQKIEEDGNSTPTQTTRGRRTAKTAEVSDKEKGDGADEL